VPKPPTRAPVPKAPPERRKRVPLKRAPIVPLPLVPASAAQREKVRDLRCVVCGRSPVDPAHLVPRTRGGCDHADCVIPLCRTHHRLYDAAQLALVVHIGRGLRRERAHARLHVSPARLARALRGDGWD
jgi:hypothetical protein